MTSWVAKDLRYAFKGWNCFKDQSTNVNVCDREIQWKQTQAKDPDLFSSSSSSFTLWSTLLLDCFTVSSSSRRTSCSLDSSSTLASGHSSQYSGHSYRHQMTPLEHEDAYINGQIKHTFCLSFSLTWSPAVVCSLLVDFPPLSPYLWDTQC